ncbi:hypothetical protein WKI68_04150 [Streptomyces sp. MS1.HAVA.3]|uniref:Uncharacterized protein n=1 Tax=Streptomyces caledonius TaxID=3134107 RepID=A0ABU8TZN1_9ACTN
MEIGRPSEGQSRLLTFCRGSTGSRPSSAKKNFTWSSKPSVRNGGRDRPACSKACS